MTGRPQVSHPRGSTARRPTLSHCPLRAARLVAARLPLCGCSRLPGPASQRCSGSRPGPGPTRRSVLAPRGSVCTCPTAVRDQEEARGA